MASPVELAASRTYPVPVEKAYERTIGHPLPDLFRHRYGLLPPIRKVTGPETWATAGQQRTITLADGGTLRETLTVTDAPREFGYLLDEITGPLALLAARVDGAWRFTPAGTGTRVTWSWLVHPASTPASYVMPVLARLWNGYARQALENLEGVLLAEG
jgi:hypothetical protein